MPANKNAMPAATRHGAKSNFLRQDRISQPSAHQCSSPIDLLLARLDAVRKSGRGWTARCPAHEDRTASLSIAEGDDGRVLIHDFAGCAIADVLGAVGLSLVDLFPQHERRDLSPMERRQRREYAQAAQVRAVLNVLGLESKIVSIAAHDLAAGGVLDVDDCKRLALAVSRIEDARKALAA